MKIEKNAANLRKAFIRLLGEKDFNSITVKDITKTCGINRTTFYTYYSDKEELAKECCEIALSHLENLLKQYFDIISLVDRKKFVFDLYTKNSEPIRTILAMFDIHYNNFEPYEELQVRLRDGCMSYTSQNSNMVQNRVNQELYSEWFAAIGMTTMRWWNEHPECDISILAEMIIKVIDQGLESVIR